MSDKQPRSVLRYLHRLVGGPAVADASDRDLLEQFARGRSEEAFETLVARHGPLVRGVCRRVLGNPTDADDAFQATFLVLAKKAGSVRWQHSVGPWLHAVARRISLKTRTSLQRRRDHEKNAGRPPASTGSSDDLSWRELQSVIDEELHNLPERYRAPLILCYLEGKTRDEAAADLGWSEGSVKGRLERGRELLRERLARRGLTLSAAMLGMLVANPASAAVPAALQASTVQAGALFAAGHSVTDLVSAQALASTKSVLDGMAIAKLKLVAGVAAIVAATTVGTGVWMGSRTGAAGETQVARAAEPPPPPAKVEAPEPPPIEKEKDRPRDGDRKKDDRPRDKDVPREGDRKKEEPREKDKPRDGGQLAGKILNVNLERRALRVLSGEREETYPIANDVQIIGEDGRERGDKQPKLALKQLAPGNRVLLDMAADGKTITRIRLQPAVERGVLKSVNAAERIIVVAIEGKNRPLKVSPKAPIVMGRREATLEQLKAGMIAEVKISPDGTTALMLGIAEGERPIKKDGDRPREK